MCHPSGSTTTNCNSLGECACRAEHFGVKCDQCSNDMIFTEKFGCIRKLLLQCTVSVILIAMGTTNKLSLTANHDKLVHAFNSSEKISFQYCCLCQHHNLLSMTCAFAIIFHLPLVISSSNYFCFSSFLHFLLFSGCCLMSCRTCELL